MESHGQAGRNHWIDFKDLNSEVVQDMHGSMGSGIVTRSVQQRFHSIALGRSRVMRRARSLLRSSKRASSDRDKQFLTQ
jgi:hypothetical protein